MGIVFSIVNLVFGFFMGVMVVVIVLVFGLGGWDIVFF